MGVVGGVVARWAALAVALATAGVSGAAAAEVEIERMTSAEVAAAVRSGRTTILIPTGGTEQNGAHMVLGKHNLIVAETARRIARELGTTLVAPVLAYVPEGDIARRAGNMAYAGTISLPEGAYKEVLRAAAESFKVHGFRTIVLLGDSGGNQGPQRDVAAELSRRWRAEGVQVVNAEAYYGSGAGDAWLRSQGESDADIGTHAGIRDTSELMAVAPWGVRIERAAKDRDGVSGDPARASLARGQTLIDLKVAAGVAEIRSFEQRAPASPSAAEPRLGILARLKRLIMG